MKRAFLAAAAAAFLFHFADARLGAQGPPTPLSFFQSYFVTGDYVVGGAGLYNTGGVGNIPVAGVPDGAEILAAFLYWQVVADQGAPLAGSLGVTFKGNPLSAGALPYGKSLGTGASCPLSGGSSTRRTFGYRADVMRYFLVGENGRQLVNGSHAITVPSTSVVRPLGASLVVVYRSPNVNAPLKAVVLYDGTYTMVQGSLGVSQTIRGFYDGTAGPARLTPIVGSAQPILSERLRFNGALLSNNPFRSLAGGQWDNPTFNVATPAVPGGVTNEVNVSADYQGILLQDCVSWAATIFSTSVEDGDGDGLLDIWEESATPLFDPTGQPLLVDAAGQPTTLQAMNADPALPDVFVEIGSMQTGPPAGPLTAYSYGGVAKPAHSHMPDHEALKLVGDAFKGSGPLDRIRIHFDVGPNYPLGDLNDPKLNAEEYLVPRNLARGGEVVDEATTVCTRLPTDPEYVCQFGNLQGEPTPSAFPGTVGWKTGFRFIRDEVFSISPVPVLGPGETADDYCGTLVPNSPTGQRYVCERRFDENRLNIFRYALFAHHVGRPKSVFACLLNGVPVHPDVNDKCVLPAVPNPEFHIPITSSGIGDFPGADSIVTLGGFPDAANLPIGTPFMQASTLMHELGHNFQLRHGGGAFEPNCKPTYLSVMNYM
jgi:hypothetical protein